MLLFVAIGGEVVRQLWNWLLPPLFGWRQITFWQALGLLALCRILFGGFGGRGSHRSNIRRRMAERWEAHDPRGAGTVPASACANAAASARPPARARHRSNNSLPPTYFEQSRARRKRSLICR